MGTIYGNVENNGRDTHCFTVPNHREAGASEDGQDMSHTNGRRSMENGRDAVRGNLYCS